MLIQSNRNPLGNHPRPNSEVKLSDGHIKCLECGRKGIMKFEYFGKYGLFYMNSDSV